MSFLENLAEDTNYGYTENGAIKHDSTLNPVLDMFALGGAYRKRGNKDIEELFGDAYRTNKDLALKCLFYLRDVRGGQGERRFFRVAYKWLIKNDIQCASRNLTHIPTFGRWDDLIDICYGTVLADKMFDIIKLQLTADMNSDTPSLLAKWMPSENASNKETKLRAMWFAQKLVMSARDYRKMLSILRKKIKVLETSMSANNWDDIEFDKIPALAGLKYQHAFATREETRDRYIDFINNSNTKVNADVLTPFDIARRVFAGNYFIKNDDDRAALVKYWDNLKDYYCGREENAIAVVDVSGSMTGTPMAAAVGMGAYVAEKSHGPFANHFITFSAHPQLVKFEGDDIVDKMLRCRDADWGMNTNIEAVMDLLLNTAIKHHSPQSDLPARLYIFSDMEFDRCLTSYKDGGYEYYSVFRDIPDTSEYETLFESIERKWAKAGYKMPKITFWNLDARTNNIPAIGENFNYISGFSMSMMEAVMAGKTALDMMLDVLLSKRYEVISA